METTDKTGKVLIAFLFFLLLVVAFMIGRRVEANEPHLIMFHPNMELFDEAEAELLFFDNIAKDTTVIWLSVDREATTEYGTLTSNRPFYINK